MRSILASEDGSRDPVSGAGYKAESEQREERLAFRTADWRADWQNRPDQLAAPRTGGMRHAEDYPVCSDFAVGFVNVGSTGRSRPGSRPDRAECGDHHVAPPQDGAERRRHLSAARMQRRDQHARDDRRGRQARHPRLGQSDLERRARSRPWSWLSRRHCDGADQGAPVVLGGSKSQCEDLCRLAHLAVDRCATRQPGWDHHRQHPHRRGQAGGSGARRPRGRHRRRTACRPA